MSGALSPSVPLITPLVALQEGKKKFDKETNKFCVSLERHLNLSTKKSENSLQEVSARTSERRSESSVGSSCFRWRLSISSQIRKQHGKQHGKQGFCVPLLRA